MPVYEFYCPDCHTVFNFLSRTVDPAKRPACPRCARPDLERQVSRFAVSRGRKEADEPDLPPGLDEAKLEQAMEAMAGEAEGLDENDPRQMANMMRKLYGATGLPMGGGMEEAIRRLEAGEDPDAIEEQLGDVFENEDPFSAEGIKRFRHKHLPPKHEETLYEL
jgi:putative FmdB family regulatory protein